MATIQIADNDARVQYTQAVTAGVTQLTIDFPFFDLDDINVIFTTAAGVDTSLSRGTGTGTFAVVGTAVDDGFSGGYITLGDTYSAGTDTFTIFRDIPVARTTDFPTSGPFNISALNTDLDKIIAIEQELETKISRTMKLSDSDTAASITLPSSATRAQKFLSFDANGAVTVTATIGTFQGTDTTTTTAAYVKHDLVKSTTTAQLNNVYICIQDSPIGTLLTNTSYWTLVVDAVSAATSATNAATSATNAANSATQATTNGAAQVTLAAAQVALATTQANNAATSATTATTQASNASSSATAAAASAAAAALSADTFDDTYLGSKASDPSVDNDGDPLNAGDLYFNTTSNELKVYNGSAWQTAAVSTTGLLTVANNLSDVASAATAQTNLGGTTVGKALFTAASVNAAQQAVDLEVGVDVQAFDADTAKLDVAQTFTAAQRGSTDTDATNTGSVTLDFAVNQNFVLTLTGNVTLANPTTESVGQSGFIVFIQDGTGGRTVSLGTDYETAGAAGLTLSTAASTTDVVPYIVAASGRILLGQPLLAFA
jgi:hypothetical protein